ncbi:unnamed protein product [Moneuplotes crassus]|uniref:NlpC/P60 domain-containing protein n=1 Tax=Euplotes crassus TaxID=5936 RepID=A0AAD1U5W0_EUPCR|nr:unnamed protein product [Moneuplotes crassus]
MEGPRVIISGFAKSKRKGSPKKNADLLDIISLKEETKTPSEEEKTKKEEIENPDHTVPIIEKYYLRFPQLQINRKNIRSKKKLRQLFIDTVKKYIGVPYARRKYTPDENEYYYPIYLDCCGLIRRAMYDLKDNFGFKIGPGNQGYQVDTLPIDLRQTDLKPGDLIFYSGTAINPKKKPWWHHMKHVEMFTGGPTGVQSIGSRGKKKVVNYFDSFKFVSRSYTDIKWHYKSIDTWLEGKCKIVCQVHRLKGPKMKKKVKSAYLKRVHFKKQKQKQKRLESFEQKKNTNFSVFTAFTDKSYSFPAFQ